MRDCLFLVADKNMEGLLKGFFSREGFHQSLRCSPFQFHARQDLVVAHGQNDSGLYSRADELLGGYHKTHRHAVIILDAEWDGSPGAQCITEKLKCHLENAGWQDETGCAVVIDPELENWVWQDNPHVCTALGYHGSFAELRSCLANKGFWMADESKPKHPKEAVEWILRSARRPRSSSIYQQLAGQVSVKRCTDGAFQALLAALRRWFPAEGRR